MIREWRAALLDQGVSVSTAAKAYRLLRAVLMTAVDEDKILSSNPCRIRGAGDERAPERPVLTVAQVFELAERVGRRPFGNVRQVPGNRYRLRFQRDGEMRTSPEVYSSRAEAIQALWKMAGDCRADCHHDARYRALVLLATFASLRWGEVIALRRCNLDLERRTVRVRAAYVERSTGEMLLGPPKSRAGRRVVGIPGVIVPELREHLATYVKDEPGALVFAGQKGMPLRRSNFNKISGWPHAVESIGAAGLHGHDLRHTGNQFAANSGAGLKDLMTRMGHNSERAALIYQHEARGADQRITDAIDSHVQAERDQDDDGPAGALVPAG
jgi:integrase